MNQTKTSRIWVVTLLIVLIVGTVGYYIYRKSKEPALTASSTPVVLANFDDCKAHNYPVIETYPEQCTGPDGTIYVQDFSEASTSTMASSTVAATTTPNALTYKDLIQVNDLQKGQVITNPLHVEGEARGQWFFEAVFPIKIEDSKGNILGSGPAEASGAWATTSYVGFTADITFTKPTAPSSTGYVVLSNDNPSGSASKAYSFKIPVSF